MENKWRAVKNYKETHPRVFAWERTARNQAGRNCVLIKHPTHQTLTLHFPVGHMTAPWDVGDGDTKQPPGGLLTPAFNPHCAATETPKSQGLSTGQVICGDQEN